MNNFADRLIESIRNKKSCVCVGLDPKTDLIPAEILSNSKSPAQAIYNFNKAIIDIVKNDVVAVKPQSAFYEKYLSEGIQCFFDTIEYAHQKGLIVIADIKRSDIASTAEAYAEAYLKNSSADSITVNPFLGTDSLEPFIKSCQENGKGLFILLKTSNPGSKDFQDAILKDNRKLYELIAEKIELLGKELIGANGYSSIGAVVGATFPQEAKNIRKLLPKTFFLVPGYGAQGAKAEDLKDYFNNDGTGAIINASRSIIYAYRMQPFYRYPVPSADPPLADKNPQEKYWQDAIKNAVQEMNTQINNIRQ
ncbi:MAG: orotidine-5'-phosphate decarboxylase [Planctomycetota bacterium]